MKNPMLTDALMAGRGYLLNKISHVCQVLHPRAYQAVA